MEGHCWSCALYQRHPALPRTALLQSDDHTVVVHSTSDWAPLATIDKPYRRMITDTFATRLSFSPDGAALLTGNSFQRGNHCAVLVPREKWGEPGEFLFLAGHTGGWATAPQPWWGWHNRSCGGTAAAGEGVGSSSGSWVARGQGVLLAGAVVSTAFNPRMFHLPREQPNGSAGPSNGKAFHEALTNVFATGDTNRRVVGALQQPLCSLQRRQPLRPCLCVTCIGVEAGLNNAKQHNM